MRDLQLADPSVGPVMRDVANTQKPHPDEGSQEGRRLIQLWELLMIKDGTVWRSIEAEQPNTTVVVIIKVTFCFSATIVVLCSLFITQR